MIKHRIIDWKSTGDNLQQLRNSNINLRRYVCSTLNKESRRRGCDGECDTCKHDMDRSISRAELAQVFNVSDSVIFNWENGKTPIGIEDLIFYCDISDVCLDTVIEFC